MKRLQRKGLLWSLLVPFLHVEEQWLLASGPVSPMLGRTVHSIYVLYSMRVQVYGHFSVPAPYRLPGRARQRYPVLLMMDALSGVEVNLKVCS